MKSAFDRIWDHLVIDAINGAAIVMSVAFAISACTTVKAVPGAAKSAVVECAKAEAGPILDAVAQFGVQAALAAIAHQDIDWAALETSAKALGLVTGGCALSKFVAALDKAPKPEVTARALLAGPDPVESGHAALARLSAKFDGAVWR